MIQLIILYFRRAYLFEINDFWNLILLILQINRLLLCLIYKLIRYLFLVSEVTLIF